MYMCVYLDMVDAYSFQLLLLLDSRLPLPPCAFSTLYKNDQRFEDVYFSEYEVGDLNLKPLLQINTISLENKTLKRKAFLTMNVLT